MAKAHHFRVATLSELRECLHEAEGRGGSYVYRGQSCATWGLATSLERIAGDMMKDRAVSVVRREKEIIEEFQRYSHLYLARQPATSELLEWLGLIQHFSGPTRLLDFTYSPYIAAYFAMEHAVVDFAVWAINVIAVRDYWAGRRHNETDWLAQQLGKREGGTPGVCEFVPRFGNERIRAQRGLFMAVHDGMRSFEENLAATLDVRGNALPKLRSSPGQRRGKGSWIEPSESVALVKISIPVDRRGEFERELDEMNINAGSLYPGLDGLGKSMRTLFTHDQLH